MVEDHPVIARQVIAFMDGLHWQTDHAATGALAIALATREPYDVVVLDLNLPDIDGLDVCRAIKEKAPRNVPVLMLTARDAFDDKARGFNGGADDYLTKPFDLRELALHCEALARRGQLHREQQLAIGPLLLLAREQRALHQGADLALTPAGFKILSALCEAHPRAVSRSALTHALWGAQSARQRRPQIAHLRAAQTTRACQQRRHDRHRSPARLSPATARRRCLKRFATACSPCWPA